LLSVLVFELAWSSTCLFFSSFWTFFGVGGVGFEAFVFPAPFGLVGWLKMKMLRRLKFCKTYKFKEIKVRWSHLFTITIIVQTLLVIFVKWTFLAGFAKYRLMLGWRTSSEGASK
jgi:hypothetical protein